ncbi:hypothetical protein PSPO01_11304 [Paraphaeosphaeria sporulosa]
MDGLYYGISRRMECASQSSSYSTRAYCLKRIVALVSERLMEEAAMLAAVMRHKHLRGFQFPFRDGGSTLFKREDHTSAVGEDTETNQEGWQQIIGPLMRIVTSFLFAFSTSSKCRRRETRALAAPLFFRLDSVGPGGDRAPLHSSLNIESFMHAILLRFKRHRTPPGLCHQDGARHQETQLAVDNGDHAPIDTLARTP